MTKQEGGDATNEATKVVRSADSPKKLRIGIVEGCKKPDALFRDDARVIKAVIVPTMD